MRARGLSALKNFSAKIPPKKASFRKTPQARESSRAQVAQRLLQQTPSKAALTSEKIFFLK